MELRNKLYTPKWRDPTYLKGTKAEQRFRFLFGWLAVLCVLGLLVTDSTGYDKAISMQLASGALSARFLFTFMFLTLGYMALRLWLWRRFFSAFAALAIIGALGIIALTDPMSTTHNDVFVTLALLICGGNVAFFVIQMDWKLLVPAAGSMGGLILCPFHLGIGERLLIASSCLGLAIIYYDILDP